MGRNASGRGSERFRYVQDHLAAAALALADHVEVVVVVELELRLEQESGRDAGADRNEEVVLVADRAGVAPIGEPVAVEPGDSAARTQIGEEEKLVAVLRQGDRIMLIGRELADVRPRKQGPRERAKLLA